jgi:hypothetical protein
MDTTTASDAPLLYLWLSGDPQVVPFDLTIPDVPGVSDLELIASAMRDGRLGTILPPRISFAPRPDPGSSIVRAVDVGRMLRDYRIRHRRRYEIMLPNDGS